MLANKKALPDWVFYLLPLLAGSKSLYLLLVTVTGRWDYPYELEWIEGSVLQHVVRVLQHKPLYVLPDMQYAPALYTPGYYYVAALFAKFFGAGLPTLRAVSFLASLLASLFVAGTVWQVTKSLLAVCLSVLSCAAIFPFSGYWFDVARVDSLWLC